MQNKKTLTFMGNGSCFNADFGNNAAYHIDAQEKSMLLIDCGESIFERVKKQRILDDIKELHILITHLHSDHAGSLSSLLFFCKYGYGMIPTVIYPEKNIMSQYLTLVGNEPQDYQLIAPEECKKYKMQEIKQMHSIAAYGYIIEINGKRIYYSGDTKTVPEFIIKAFRTGKLDEFYQDVSRYETPAHMHVETLSKIFEKEERKKITCMHFDDEITRQKAECLGFDISKVKEYKSLER